MQPHCIALARHKSALNDEVTSDARQALELWKSKTGQLGREATSDATGGLHSGNKPAFHLIFERSRLRMLARFHGTRDRVRAALAFVAKSLKGLQL